MANPIFNPKPETRNPKPSLERDGPPPAPPEGDNGGENGDDAEGNFFSWRNFAGLFLVPAAIVAVCVILSAGLLMLANEEGKVNDYVRQLQSPDIKKRWEAAMALAYRGVHDPILVPVLVKILKQPATFTTRNPTTLEWQVTGLLRLNPEERQLNLRWYAALYLGQFPHEDEALAAALEATGDADAGVRLFSIRALATMVGALTRNLQGLKALRSARGGLSPEARAELVRLERRLDQVRPRAGRRIVKGAQDEDARVRWATAYALHLFPGPEPVRVLRGLLEDPDESVRLHAALSLGTLGEPSVRPILEKLARHEKFHVRAEAHKVLERLGQTSQP